MKDKRAMEVLDFLRNDLEDQTGDQFYALTHGIHAIDRLRPKTWMREDEGYGITFLVCPECQTRFTVDSWGRDLHKWHFCACCGKRLNTPKWGKSAWEDDPE